MNCLLRICISVGAIISAEINIANADDKVFALLLHVMLVKL